MVESPCIKICELNSNGVCSSCGRTRQEIVNWTSLSDDQKQKIINRINNEE